MTADRFRMGIDENGLGPRLGPLVVTAIIARVSETGGSIAAKKPRGALAKRLGDSKAMVSHGDVALGEAWARALAARVGLDAERPDALIHSLALESRAELRRLCPSHVESQCWNTEREAFEAEHDLVAQVSLDLDKLAVKGVDVVGVRSSLVCTKRLNDERSHGRSRFDVDLHAMERIVLDARERHTGDLDVVCGKVGGYARYSDAFGPLAGRLHAIIEEGAKRSAYSFPGLGTISFVRDADASHMLVAMASMVGKWIREVMMARIVRFYGHRDDAMLDASGYHDPVTDRFVAATALVRRKKEIPSACFERVGPAEGMGRAEGQRAISS
jgi:ribonuclease HII